MYDVDYNRTAVRCILEDDGAAIVDLGFDATSMQAVEMTLGRIANGVFLHSELGPLYVQSLWYSRLVADYLVTEDVED